jgi:predicted nucleic acid-binding protein
MIYLDSCILIYRLEGAAPFRVPVVEAMRAAASEAFCISDLVRLECFVGPFRDQDAERKAAFDLAAELRAAHRLRTPDALHAACALTHSCGEIWTNDGRFAAIEDRLKVRVVP